MPLPTYLMSNFPSVRPSLNLQFDSQPTPEDMTSHLASVGATFSRASIGTYTDANGLIQEASAGQARPNYSTAGVHEGLLIEESRTNLVKSSEDFSTTDWTKEASVTITSGQSNTLNDDATATLIDLDSSDFIYSNATVSASTNYNFSFFIKAGTASTHYYAFYDNSNSSFIVSETEYTYTDGEDYGNGWYRVNFNVTTPSGCTSIRVYPLRSTSGGSGNGTTLLFGAQLEEGSFPTSYIPTIPTFSSRASTATYFDSSGVLQTASTNVARTDHKYIDGQWVEAGLLLEGASENELVQSEDLGTTWNTVQMTITTNQIDAPDGNTTADKVSPDTNQGSVYQPIAITSSTTYTYSVYMKKAENDFGMLRTQWDGSNYDTINFDLVNGTTSRTPSDVDSTSIEDVGNGWYRCIPTFTPSSTVTTNFQIRTSNLEQTSNSGNYSGTFNGTNGIYAWGAQLEEGSQPTSYIPTSGSTVTRSADVYTTATKTRSADVCYIDGTAFTDFYNQEQGTWFLNTSVTPSGGGGGLLFPYNTSNPIGTRTVAFLKSSSDDNIDFAFDGSYVGDIITTDEYDIDAFNKFAISIIEGAVNVYSNGSSAYSAIRSISENLNKVFIGAWQGGVLPLNASMKKLIYFPRKLDNNELIKLTQ